MLNIIVIEDHDALREATVEALMSMGYQVRGASCAEELDDELATFRADLLVIDLGLPGEDGVALSKRIRSAQPDIGIIMVTARHQRGDMLNGYESGADIYLTKPIAPEELGAAIQALSRRLGRSKSEHSSFVLNEKTSVLSGVNGHASLSELECRLLLALGRASGNRLETWQLLELSEKMADEQSKRALEVRIVRLRKKIQKVGAKGVVIKSIRGVGYQLCIPLILRRG